MNKKILVIMSVLFSATFLLFQNFSYAPKPVEEIGKEYVCALYFAEDGSDNFIQGTWHNDLGITSSKDACSQYMYSEVFVRARCAQPAANPNALALLIPKDRHTYNLEKYDASEVAVPLRTCPRFDIDGEEMICALYYRTSSSPSFRQGTWHNSPKITSSQKSCANYMEKNVLNKPNCASGDHNTVDATVLLIPKWKHIHFTMELPPVQPEEVVIKESLCPTSKGNKH